MSLPRAAAIALLLTIPLATLFALRTSVAIFPLLTLVLWRAVSVRTLTLAAAAALGVVVPIRTRSSRRVTEVASTSNTAPS